MKNDNHNFKTFNTVWLFIFAVVAIVALFFAILPTARAEGADLLIRSSDLVATTAKITDANLEIPPMDNIITDQGAAWFLVIALVAALGVPFTRKAVDFVLERGNLAKKIKKDWRILLAFGFALGWTVFMFQDGILNIAALALLPVWQSVLVVSVMITLAASGTVDGDTRAQKKAVKLALTDYVDDSEFGDGEPRKGSIKEYS